MDNMIPFATRRSLAHRDPFFCTFFDNDMTNALLGADRYMQVDVRDEGDHYVVNADVPGFTKEELHADVKDGVLTITAEKNRTEEKQEDQGRYIYRERRYGKAIRSFNLDGIREDDITAEFHDGVLTLNLPKEQESEKDASRSIMIA